MLDKIILFSIRNKLIVGLFTVGLILWGAYSLSRLPIDAVPDITNNQVQIITQSPSLAAPDIERLVTFPVEMEMASLPNLAEIRSFSRFGLSVITVVFNESTDIYWARQQITERLKTAAENIPPGVGTPTLSPITTGLGEIYQYILHPAKGYEKQFDAMELRSIQDWIVRRQLLGIEGVADVSSFGGYLKQYQIAVNPDQLNSFRISISAIFNALENNNQNTGGAYIDKKPNAYFIRSEGLVTSLEDIEKIVVSRNQQGIPILIRDLGTVSYGHATRYGALTYNDKGEAVGGIVMMLKGANSSEVVNRVKERMAAIQKTLPEGIEMEAFLDRTKLVDHALNTVSTNLIEGALIVIFVLVLLLGNLRAGLIVASVIPLAMLFAVSMMRLFGVSGNLMSLGAIDFGLIVDGAVIIVEATLHHLLGKNYTTRLTQQQMDQEVYESASKIRKSAAFGEIIILIVYLPILALIGIEGKMFRPMAQTVSFAILGAFLLSLTYVPMVSALFLNKTISTRITFSDRIMAFFHRMYEPVLLLALRKGKLILLIVLALFGFSFFIFQNLGGEFIPQLEEGDFAVETRVLTGSSLSETIEASTKASKVLLKEFPNEVREVVGKIGAGEIPTDPMPVEACDLMVILKDRKEWTSVNPSSGHSREELADKMQAVLNQKVPGVSFGFQQPIQMRFNELMTGAKQDVVVKIFGDDLEVLARQAKKVGSLVRSVDGAEDVYVETVAGLPQIVVDFDREELARFGISVKDANQTIQTAFAGGIAGIVYEGEKRYDLVIRLQNQQRQSSDDVQNLLISTPHGEQVPLRQLAKVEVRNGVNQIQREDTKRRITIAFNVRGRDVESVVNELQQKIDENIKLPVGYFTTYGGQFQNLKEARDRLAVAVPLALALILVLLYFTFNSIRHSLLIFVAIPLSAIGGVLALWFRDMPFSISAGIGFIALFGVAVLNGIVLIAEFNSLRAQGLTDLPTIIRKGTQTRLRPVLMTALVASFGFLPMALSSSAGAEVQRPLATVVIGGLFSATLLTLLVLPILYQMTEERSFPKIAGAKFLVLALVLTSLAAFPLSSTAQTQKVNLKAAIEKAKENNLSIQASTQQTASQEALRKTAREVPKSTVSWMAGQYNSYHFDNHYLVDQTVPFPTVFKKRTDLLDAEVTGSKNLTEHRKNTLERDVKQTYYNWLFLNAQLQVFQEQHVLLTSFLKAAELRKQTGEANQLEVSTASSLLKENSVKIKLTRTERANAARQLGMFTGSNEPLEPSDTLLTKRTVVMDTTLLNQNPYLNYLNQQVDIRKKTTALQKSLLLPDLSIGYFNQSLIGTNAPDNSLYGRSKRFQGFQIGLAIPVFATAEKARIKAGKIQEEVAQTELKSARLELGTLLEQTIERFHAYQQSLEEFESGSLALGTLIQKNGTSAYQAGEIGYLEYVQALLKNMQLKNDYNQLLFGYNQTVIEIEYLINN